MKARIALFVSFSALLAGHCLAGAPQYHPQQPGQPYPPSAGPSAPQMGHPAALPPIGGHPGAPQQRPAGPAEIAPSNPPTLQRRQPEPAIQMTPEPFRLTLEQQAEVDEVLKKWEEISKTHKRFSCEFFRYEFVPAFTASPDVPLHIDQGEACFAAPDKWMFAIHGAWVDDKLVEGQRAERWVCDGRSIYQFDYKEKTVTQHVLSADIRGEDLVKALLPFLFGPEVATLKSRYFIRLLAFQGLPDDQVCIEAWPRYQDESRNFRTARMILRRADMQPVGMMLVLPNGTDSHRYGFTKVKVNSNNLLDRLLNDPFQVRIPSGWKKHVEQAPSAQVGNRPQPGTVSR